MAKKKLKFKKPRRAFDRAVLFPKREVAEVALKQMLIAQVFPDIKKRQAYIQALIKGLDEESNLENK